jgi:hypothetical protein
VAETCSFCLCRRPGCGQQQQVFFLEAAGPFQQCAGSSAHWPRTWTEAAVAAVHPMGGPPPVEDVAAVHSGGWSYSSMQCNVMLSLGTVTDTCCECVSQFHNPQQCGVGSLRRGDQHQANLLVGGLCGPKQDSSSSLYLGNAYFEESALAAMSE